MKMIEIKVLGNNFNEGNDGHVDNFKLMKINAEIRNHSIEVCRAELRAAMTAMNKIV